MKYQQLSIYDFLESQEVAPSETFPQVDEAQELESPSSDLGTKCPNCMNYPLIDGECMGLHCGYKIPAEDTDSTLFSVGDILTVRNAKDVYNLDEDPEDYFTVAKWQGLKVEVIGFEGKSVSCKVLDMTAYELFYPKELIKI